MSRYLVNARNRAESTEWSRFSPPRVEVCSVGSPRTGRDFEWAITKSIVRNNPWHHIDQLCTHALTSARAFAFNLVMCLPVVYSVILRSLCRDLLEAWLLASCKFKYRFHCSQGYPTQLCIIALDLPISAWARRESWFWSWGEEPQT